MNSILQYKKTCYICYTQLNLEIHHCFYGTANRKLSEKDGLKVWLCYEHHRGTYGVHGREGEKIDNFIKEKAEQAWIDYYRKTKEDFRLRYGRNFL